MDKVLSIWKPKDVSSFDVIRKVKKILPGLKIGHCGTLDPFAEGVLILCTGNLTKDSSSYVNLNKTYLARVIFGEETDTLDRTGTVIKKASFTKFEKKYINSKLKDFIGKIDQVPPAYSAKKINGVKMYILARKNIFIKRKPSTVVVYSIEIKKINNNKMDLLISCGKGTYIRSLARDIAYSLNTYGYVDRLQRISVGDFDKTNSIKFEDINQCLVDMNSKIPIS